MLLANKNCKKKEEMTKKINIEREIAVEEATLYLFNCDASIYTSAIIYNDGTLMHLFDWQGGRPENLNEIEEYSWLSEDGKRAIIVNRLPRLLL